MPTFEEMLEAKTTSSPNAKSFDEMLKEKEEEDLKGQTIRIGAQEFPLEELGHPQFQSKEDLQRYGTDILSGLGGLPHGLLKMPETIANQMQTLITGNEEAPKGMEQGQSALFRGIDYLASLLPEMNELRQSMTDEEATTLDRFIMAASSGLPFGPAGMATMAGFQGLEEGLEAVGASPRVKAGSRLAAMGLTAKKGLQGKNPTQKNLIETLKKYGVPDEQIAVVLEKPGLAQKWLAKAAAKEGKAEVLLNETKKGIGEVYEYLKEEHPAAESVLAPAERNLMEIELREILEDIPSQQRNVIKEDFEKFMNSPRSGRDMIKLYQDINETYAPKKSQLQRLKKPIIEALDTLDPELGGDFKVANEAWSNYASVRKIFKPREVGWLSNLSGPQGIVAAFILGNPLGLVKGLAIKGGVSLMAREMLLNPKLKNISKKLGYGINKRSIGIINTNLKELADEVEKFDPQAADQIRLVDPKDLFPPSKSREKLPKSTRV